MAAAAPAIAVIGLGRFGTSLARELTRHGIEMPAIDAPRSAGRGW
ncbi:hypothetical protein [Nonomuraea rosea]